MLSGGERGGEDGQQGEVSAGGGLAGAEASRGGGEGRGRGESWRRGRERSGGNEGRRERVVRESDFFIFLLIIFRIYSSRKISRIFTVR